MQDCFKRTVPKTFITVVLSCLAALCAAQSVPVGSAADQYLRYLQLTGASANNSGLVNRPQDVFQQAADDDSLLLRLLRTNLHFQKHKNVFVGVLPISLDQQLVTHHPLAQNDGAMIPAKGYQLQFSGGVYGKAGLLSFQVNPEIVVAANKAYEHNRTFGAAPSGSFRKVYPGQSFLRLHAGPVAVSLASENLWWGPGVHHSLLMSNQAPGFVHVKLHSTRPLKTPIGHFEWTLLGGKLTSDRNLPFDNKYQQYHAASVTSDRYLNAYVLSYMPKFLPGLSLGVARALQQYKADVDASGESVFKKYLPVILKPVQKKNAQDDDAKRIDQVASAFFRWFLKKSKAEVYAEYGYNDYKKNIRDYVLNLPNAAAYLVGFRKAFPLYNNQYIDAGIEILQLRQTTDRLVRNAGVWYIHSSIREGYTHQNQVLGAAFASNAQTFQVSHRKGPQRTTLTLQRFQRNPDRNPPNWNDWIAGFGHAQFFKGFYLDGQIQFITSQNYAWQVNRHTFQLLAKAGLRYYFHD